MCHYITATVPENADLHSLQLVARRHGQRLDPVENPHVEKQLPRGSRYVATTSGICDCGTALGYQRSIDNSDDLKQKASKFRKRGWSEDRVQRWIAEQQAKAPQIDASELSNAEKWVAFIRDALLQPAVAEFGLLLHWYKGSPGTERINLRASETVMLADLSPELLLNIEEDLLYRFRRGADARSESPR